MIQNIIFDIGNVLTDYRWKEFMEDKGYSQDMIKRIAKASTMNPYWNEYDRGKMSDKAILQAFVDQDPEIEKELRDTFDNIHDMVRKREYAIPWLQELKKEGKRVYYLSNFSRKAHVECKDALDFIPFMDGGILSYQEGVIKPDPAIYLLLMERYQLKANECLFLDDMPRNVEAAKAVGMNAIVFVDKDQAQRDMRAII